MFSARAAVVVTQELVGDHLDFPARSRAPHRRSRHRPPFPVLTQLRTPSVSKVPHYHKILFARMCREGIRNITRFNGATVAICPEVVVGFVSPYITSWLQNPSARRRAVTKAHMPRRPTRILPYSACLQFGSIDLIDCRAVTVPPGIQ